MAFDERKVLGKSSLCHSGIRYCTYSMYCTYSTLGRYAPPPSKERLLVTTILLLSYREYLYLYLSRDETEHKEQESRGFIFRLLSCFHTVASDCDQCQGYRLVGLDQNGPYPVRDIIPYLR